MAPPQENSGLPQPTERGIIIVDACALIDLAKQVSPYLRKNGAVLETYLDTLLFLSRHGYRVLIPEMASVEAGQILANGQNIDSAYRKTHTDKYKKDHDSIRPFLRNVALGHYPNIEIIADTGPQDVDAHCNALRSAMNINWGTKDKKRDFLRRSNLTQTQRSSTDDFGDKAILSMIDRDMAGIDHCKNVLVLTDDELLRDSILEKHLEGSTLFDQPRIAGLTSRKFIHALAMGGLTEKMGFAPVSRPYDITQEFSTAAYAQSSHAIVYKEAGKAWSESIALSRFYQSLLGVRKDLDAPTPPAEPEAPTQPRAAKGIAGFTKRYGNLQLTKPSSGVAER
jgi:hypothetical protein